MPPLPGKEFREQFLGGLNYITELFKHSEHPAERDNESQAHATATAIARSEDMDDVEEQSSATMRKRTREAHEEESQNAKKQRKFSQEEGRLFGKYNKPTPKDAVKVMVPTNELLGEEIAVHHPERAAKVVRAAKPMAGAHRTTNTLNNSQPGRNGAPRSSVYAQFKPPIKVTRPVTRVPPNESIGDGFNDLKSTRATSSKRRATNGASQAPTAKKTIDITGDSDELTMGEVEAVNGNRISNDSQNSVIELGSSRSRSPPKSGYFVPQEMRHVNQSTNPQPLKKRRHHPSAQGSAYNESQSQMRPSSRQTNHSTEINDLNTPASRFSKAPEHRSQKDRKHGVPEIDLGRGTGVSDIKAARDLKLLESDVKLLKGAMNMSSPPGYTKHHARGLPEGRNVEESISASPYARRHTGAGPETRTLAEELTHEEEQGEQRLSAKFHRAPNSPHAPTRQQQQQQTRRKAMLVSSSNGGSNALEDSPDQLHMTSPNLSRESADRRSSISVTRESPRQHSPSDIKTKTFTSKTTNSASVSRPARKSQKPSSHTDDLPTRIPVTQIYCRGCPVTSTESHPVELVWRESEARFEVEENGQPAGVLGRDENMFIGMNEASALFYNQNSTKLALWGSSSVGRSNGWILLRFPDLMSRKLCADYLSEASKDKMKTKHEDPVRMDNLFEKQAKAVKEDAGRYAMRVMADSAAHQHDTDQVARRKQHRQSSEERITYEQSPYFSGQDRQPRMSTRQSKVVVQRSPSPDPVAERWTQINPQTPWHQSVMYPATGARRITVDFQDLERLDEGEFLNDNIVGYALRRIEENMAPEHKSKVHFFNSYFFTSLTSKNGRKTFNYESVKKWTKQKDLFDIPYVVVPINENFHWYLAIICNLPSLKRKSAALDDRASDAVATPSTSQQASARPSPIRDPVVPDSQDVDDDDKPDAQAMESLSIESERTSREGSDVIAFGEDGKVASNSPDRPVQAKGGKKSKKRTAPALPKYPTDKPIIITLDSFGQAHTGQVASLKDYVAAEAMEKRGMEVGREDMKGMTATGVPLQQNFCDCGLYLVGYVAEFAKDPEGFVNKVLTRQLDGQSDFAAFNSSKKRDEIRADLIRLHDVQDAERLALKKAKKDGRTKGPVTAVTDASTLVASPGPRSSPGRAAPKSSTVEHSAQAPMATAIEAPSALSADASDNDEMDSGMPRALPSIGQPKKAKRSATPHTKFEDGEMVDNYDDDDATEHRPKEMRKVLSPQLDGLSTILKDGPLAVPPHAHEKSPGSEKLSS
jgi:sentrin-specific protease 7